MEVYMFFKEYPVFQTIKEAKSFCQQSSRIEKRQLLFNYIRQQEPLFTNNQRWGAPSICYLQYLMNGLYDVDEAYSRYSELTLLEKHGIAHLIISLSAPYWEMLPLIVLAQPKTPPIEYIVYMSVNEHDEKNNRYCKLYIFNPSTRERRSMGKRVDMNIGIDILRSMIQNELNCGENIFIFEKCFLEFNSDYIDYFGNYIHQKVKEKMGYEEKWAEIRTLRNRLAHPHEGISEKNLKRACDILCAKNFFEDMEALVFLLSPLLPKERQMFCQYGHHDKKEKYARIAHGICRINAEKNNKER